MIEPDSEEHFETHAESFFSKKGFGANITIPFKEQAYAFANNHDVSAIECGCANTLILQNNKITYYITFPANVIPSNLIITKIKKIIMQV